ncbi:unnamed protein product [Sphagnum balticum]
MPSAGITRRTFLDSERCVEPLMLGDELELSCRHAERSYSRGPKSFRWARSEERMHTRNSSRLPVLEPHIFDST